MPADHVAHRLMSWHIEAFASESCRMGCVCMTTHPTMVTCDGLQEFCVGGSLCKFIAQQYLKTPSGGVHTNRVLESLRHIADGMAYMHKLRMVHGDLNPSNILLQFDSRTTPRQSGDGIKWQPMVTEAAAALDRGQCQMKLSDFGLSVQLQHGRSHVSNVHHGTSTSKFLILSIVGTGSFTASGHFPTGSRALSDYRVIM
jgi:serine/threonine protein kinase